MHSNSPLLLVEDNDEDYFTFESSFRATGAENELVRCSQGEEAFDLLEKKIRSGDQMFALIVLDLNLGGLDGREVLKRIKAHPTFRKLPVVILSTSSNPTDIDFCYSHGASCYALKPVDLVKF